MIGLLILSLIFIYLFNFYKKVKSLPPGPIPIPIFGNLFTCDIKNIHNWVLGLKKQYGSVFTIWLPYPQVIFADYDTINESLVANGDHFIGRNIYAFPEKMMHEKPNVGVIMSEGDEWRDQRRLSVQILRNFGMSRTIIEDKIQLSIDDSLEYLDNLKDKDHIDIAKVLQLAVGNVINLILFGYMHKHGEEKELNEFVEAFENSLEVKKGLIFRFMMIVPDIDKIPILNTFIYRKLSKYDDKMREINRIQTEKCKKSYNRNEEPPNFVHAVMKETENIDSKYSYLNSDHLQGMVMDFWLAGMETSTTTLKWFFVLIMKYMDVQKKLQDEIDYVVGRDRQVKLSDKINMPYMSAFITEGQRYINMLPFIPSHKCTKDTIIGGHLIKAGTMTQPFFWGANYDEKYFKDPLTFRPERFLEDDGKTYKVRYDHMAFGKGKRICAGKSLAEAELFLFFTSFLQRYKFTHPSGPVDTTCKFSGILSPKKYTCKIERY